MATTPGTALNVRFAGEGTMVREFQVEPLGNNLYRVMEIPVLVETVSYRDIVELTRGQDDVYECVAVRELAGWRRFDFLVAKDAASERLTEILSRVVAAGGVWNRALGGWLSIVMPPDSTWDPTAEIRGGPASPS
jgi:hypothetical protein